MIPAAIRQYVLVISGAAGLFALLALVTAAAYIHNVRIDLSPGDRYTISDHGMQVLRDLDQPVKVTGFIRTEDARNPVLKDLLWQAANESNFIDYSILDVNRNPATAAEYGVDAYGSTVVESTTRRSDFANPSESQLISALLYVTQPSKLVYMLSGHGECSSRVTDRHVGCSQLRDALRSEFYDVEELSLLDGREVPTDTDVLIIAGPQRDPLKGELAALDGYLDRGGKLLVMLDPFVAPRFAAWLRGWSIELGDHVVIDPENRLGGGEPLSAVATDVNRNHLITARLEAPPLFSGTRAVKARTDEDAGRSVIWLLKSGPKSWANHDPAVLRGAAPQFVAGRDLNGPLTLAVEVSMPATKPVAGDDSRENRTRIIAIGDSEFVSNRFLDYLGNRDLVLNAVNWLARAERLIAPRAPAKEPGKEFFYPTQKDLEGIVFGAVLGQPGAFLLIGIGVFVMRRLRP